eukprot:UN10187
MLVEVSFECIPEEGELADVVCVAMGIKPFIYNSASSSSSSSSSTLNINNITTPIHPNEALYQFFWEQNIKPGAA